MKNIFFAKTIFLIILSSVSAPAQENSSDLIYRSKPTDLSLFKDSFDFEDTTEGNTKNFKCYGILMASSGITTMDPKSYPNSAYVTVDFNPQKGGWGAIFMSNNFDTGPKDFTYASLKVSMKVLKNRNASIDNHNIVPEDVNGFVSFWLKDEDGTTAVMSQPYRFKPSSEYQEFTAKVRNVDQVSAEEPTADRNLDLNKIIAVGICIFRDRNSRLDNLLDFYIDDFIVEKDFAE